MAVLAQSFPASQGRKASSLKDDSVVSWTGTCTLGHSTQAQNPKLSLGKLFNLSASVSLSVKWENNITWLIRQTDRYWRYKGLFRIKLLNICKELDTVPGTFQMLFRVSFCHYPGVSLWLSAKWRMLGPRIEFLPPGAFVPAMLPHTEGLPQLLDLCHLYHQPHYPPCSDFQLFALFWIQVGY